MRIKYARRSETRRKERIILSLRVSLSPRVAIFHASSRVSPPAFPEVNGGLLVVE